MIAEITIDNPGNIDLTGVHSSDDPYLDLEIDADVTERRIRGAAEIYVRARAWGHLPTGISFANFIRALERGDNPFCRGGANEKIDAA